MEKNEYHLIIDINGDVNAGGGVSKVNNETQKQLNAVKNLVKNQVAQPFINTTKQIIANEVDTRVGSSQVTQRINMGLSVVHQAYNVGVQGASLGTLLGVGSGVGVAITGALKLLEFGLNVVSRQQEINNQKYLEDEQLSILRGRAGVQFNRSRSGE